MKCYIAQMKPFSDEKRQLDYIETFQKNSIANNICGMGWNQSDILEDVKDEIKLSEYKKIYRDEYISRSKETNPKWHSGKFSSALNAYEDMHIGDFILTRLFKSNECFIGKVTKEAFYNKKSLEFEYADNYSWVVKIEWKSIGHFSNIPNSLRGIMQGRMDTIKKIPAEALQNELIRNLFDGSNHKVTLNHNNFHLAMDSLDLEDLVAIYIAKNNQDYYLLPSSCKITEPGVEYKLVCGNKRITCQVKSNAKINVSDYTSLCSDYDKIYLFSGKGYDNDPKPPQNLVFINKSELFEILITDFENKGYFYSILSDYFICKNL